MATITITHTREDGTLLDGSSKGDGVYEIVQQHGFRYSRHVGIYIRGSRDKEAQHWRINGAVEALRAAGHEVRVEIDENDDRSFAEIEAAREERAEDRAERFSNRAGRAAAASNARRDAAHDISRRFEFGQPILVGHHSERRARRDQERIDDNMRKSIAENQRAGYWANRAEAAAAYKKHRNDPYRTLRRLEKLRADLRQQERYHAEAVEKGYDSVDRHARLIRDLKKEIGGWEEVVEKAKAEGVKIWGPEDFAPGDYALYSGSWYQVHRVNPKTLSIAWNLRLAPKHVMTLEDATERGRVWTHTADYTNVRARCPEAAMNAFLADGKVPGARAAHAASEKQPASAVREAQAAAVKTKPKKKSDPKVPRKVFVDCPLGGAEATLTWLNGGSRPHRNFEPVKITAPEGGKFHRAVWSRTLQAEIARILGEQGYECCEDDWQVSRDRNGFVRPIRPKAKTQVEPEAEPAIEEHAADVPAGEPEAAPQAPAEDAPEGAQGTEEGAEGHAVQIAEVCERAAQLPEVERTPELDAAYRRYVDDGIASTDGWYCPLDFQAWATTLGAHLVTAAAGEREATAEGVERSPVEVGEVPTQAAGAEPEGEKTPLTCEISEISRNHTASTSVVHSDYPLSSTVKEVAAVTVEMDAARTATATKKATPKKAAPKKAVAKRVVEPTKVQKRREVHAEKVEALGAIERRTTRKKIPLHRIERDPSQPREEFDQGKLVELANSMKRLGQLQPATVEYNPVTKKYVIVMGERRWRAAQIAKLPKLDCIVSNGSESEREVLAKQVAENVGRADMTPMEEAKSFQRLVDAEYTIDEVAEMCGKSAAYVGWRIDLLRLCDEAREALSKAHLPVGMAWYVSKLSCENQMRFLAKYARGHFANDRAAEEFVKACLAEEKRRESQGSFFVLAGEDTEADGSTQEAIPGAHDVTEEERERIMDERAKLTKKIDRLSTAGEILSELATADPEELALLLAGTPGGVPGHQMRMDHLAKLIGKVSTNLRKAQAHAEVRASGIVVNPEVAA
ncbi:ParB/RepB/Spo0J family partition protein [Streptomyces eurythermus]